MNMGLGNQISMQNGECVLLCIGGGGIIFREAVNDGYVALLKLSPTQVGKIILLGWFLSRYYGEQDTDSHPIQKNIP